MVPAPTSAAVSVAVVHADCAKGLHVPTPLLVHGHAACVVVGAVLLLQRLARDAVKEGVLGVGRRLVVDRSLRLSRGNQRPVFLSQLVFVEQRVRLLEIERLQTRRIRRRRSAGPATPASAAVLVGVAPDSAAPRSARTTSAP